VRGKQKGSNLVVTITNGLVRRSIGHLTNKWMLGTIDVLF
jgi:hypothetical protein